jgi:oligopeptide/dipeptide ABC transporter ATP-binding protein
VSVIPDSLLDVRDLHVHIPVHRGPLRRVMGRIRAVDGVSLRIAQGTTLGLVGESGCGKTTLARAILRLVPASSGIVRFAGVELFTAAAATLRGLRRRMQIVFQDPVDSLDPRMTVERIIGEPLAIHRTAAGHERRRRVAEMMERVGLSPQQMNRYPHEFSGGQRQRIGIARALVLQPELVICDEPVSALDVSVQSQIINLLSDLQSDLGLTYLFIAHNLAVVKHVADRVAVMYLGKIVEIAPAQQLYDHPRHPYTMALLAAVPQPDPGQRRERPALAGDVPSPLSPPAGCAFHPRCPYATDQCRSVAPTLDTNAGDGGEHFVACHHAGEVASPNGASSGR